MLLAQISTFVIGAALLCLLFPRRGADAFSRVLFLYLCCTFIVIFAGECTQREKWKWFVVKVTILMANLIVHRRDVRYRASDLAFSLGILTAYLSVADLPRIYECRVRRVQLGQAFVAALSAYTLMAVAASRGT